MMRRFVQNPAPPSPRRQIGSMTLSNRNPARLRVYNVSSSSNNKNDIEPMMLHVDQRMPPTFLPTIGFGLKGYVTRQLSTEAIHARSSNTDDFFCNSIHLNKHVMKNPFLSSDRIELITRKEDEHGEAIAFLELFKAISSLNRQPIPRKHSLLDEKFVDNAYVKLSADVTEGKDVEEDEYDGNTINISQQTAHQYAGMITEKERLILDLHSAMEAKNHHVVVKLFEESLLSEHHHQLLGKEQLQHMIRFLSHRNVFASFAVLKYFSSRCKEKGRMVSLELYLKVIRGIHWANGKELRNLVKEIHQHIQDEFFDGKKLAYQHLLLPELVLVLAGHKDRRVNACAKPVMEHIMEKQFPLLNPDLYETLLEKSSFSRSGPIYLPYHKVLNELVSQGVYNR